MKIPPPKDHAEGFLKLVHEAKGRVTEIGIEQYQNMLAEGIAGQLVDVREDSEWDVAHAANAIHLGKGVIERDIEHTFPNKETKLVLYCGGGFRSALTADSIQKMGYTNVFSLDGGWRAILLAGLPIIEP
jgi:rhodanese-related sulfurtransferase